MNPIRNRLLLRIGIAEAISGTGSWITQIAMFALLVFEGGGGTAEASGVWLAGLGPALLLGPIAGRLADRFDRARLMMLSEAGCGFVVLALAFVNRVELVFVLLAVQSVCASLFMPARQAALPHLVSDRDLPRANAFLQQMSGIVKLCAPFIAAALLTVLSPQQAMLLDVASYVISVALLSRLTPLRPVGTIPQAACVRTRFTDRMLTWVGPILGSRPLVLLCSLQFVAILIMMGFDVLSPVFTRDILLGDESLFGVLVSVIGVGSIGASAFLMLRKGQIRPWRGLPAGLALLGFIPCAMAIAAHMSNSDLARCVVVAGCLAGGIGNGLLGICAISLLQTLSPRHLLGTVLGLYQSVATAGQLAAMILVPVLVPVILSMGTYFIISAVMIALLCLFTLLATTSRFANALPNAGAEQDHSPSGASATSPANRGQESLKEGGAPCLGQ